MTLPLQMMTPEKQERRQPGRASVFTNDAASTMATLNVAFLLSKGYTPEEVKTHLTTPHTLSRDTLNALHGYAGMLGWKEDALVARYKDAQMWYSSDIVFAVGRDPLATLEKLTGFPSAISLPGSTFGYTYAHGGGPLLGKVRISPAKTQRDTVIVVDSKLFQEAGNQEAWLACIEAFSKFAALANHDPLHSICGNPEVFQHLDKHYRFGGVEFAPVVAHGEYIRSHVLTQEKVESLLLVIDTLVDNARQCSTDRHKAYWVSVTLRHLLLVVPIGHPLVEHLLSRSHEVLFNDRHTVAPRERWDTFLAKHFSDGDEPDSIEKTRNAVLAYEHGKHSVLSDWYRQYFKISLPQDSTNALVPWRTLLLLDVLTRGYGTYGIVTATHQNSELIRECLLPFRAPSEEPITAAT